jgi:putative transposase
MKNDFVNKNRSVSDLKVHLVLTSKYRRKVFTGEMLNRMHDIFLDLLVKWDCKLIEFNGEEDHIHLLFQYYSPGKAAEKHDRVLNIHKR